MIFFLYTLAALMFVAAVYFAVMAAGSITEWILLAPNFPGKLRRFAFAALSGLFFSGLLRVFV